MPENDQQTQDQTNQPPPDETAKAAAPVSREEFNALSESIKAMNTSLQAIASSRNTPVGGYVPPPVADEPLPSDDEIAEELRNDGKGTKLSKRISGEIKRFQKEQVDPLRTAGFGAMSSMALKVAKLSGTIPHYDKFKAEIDNYIKQLSPDQQSNPDSLKLAHDIVVGGHVNELVKEATDTQARTNRERGGTDLPGSSLTRVPSQDELDAEAILGKDGLAAITGTGKTLEGVAKMLGFKTPKEYLEFVKAEKEGTTVPPADTKGAKK